MMTGQHLERQEQQQGQSLMHNDLLWVAYLAEFGRRRQFKFSKLIDKCNGLCTLVLGAYVCNVDLMGGLEPCDGTRQESWTRPALVLDDDDTGDSKTPGPVNPTAASAGGCLVRNLLRWLPRPMRRSRWRRRLRLGWLSQAILVAYALLNLIVITNIVCLFRYNTARLKLKRVRELIEVHGRARWVALDDQRALDLWQVLAAASNITLAGQGGAHHSSTGLLQLGHYEQVLMARVAAARHLLSLVGDKFINWGAVNECMYLFLITLCLLLYLLTQSIYLWANRPEHQLFRDSVDFDGEQRRVEACCETEVFRFLESARLHARLVEASIWALAAKPSSAGACLGGQRQWPTAASSQTPRPRAELPPPLFEGVMRRHVEGELRVGRLLTQMLAAGALKPLNRSDLWLERRNLAQFAISLNILAYCVLFDACVLYLPYGNAFTRFDLGERCGLTLVLLVDCAITHHVTTLVVSCLDQAMLVARVLELIHDCIRLNGPLCRALALAPQEVAAPERWRAPTGGAGEVRDRRRRLLPLQVTTTTTTTRQTIDKINANYLFTLMTYKIFVAQLAPFRRSLRGVFMLAFSISFIVPLLVRLYVPYLERDPNAQLSGRQLRWFGLLVSAVILLPVNAVCLPPCIVHARCQKLYKALSGLMAHIAEVRRQGTGLELEPESGSGAHKEPGQRGRGGPATPIYDQYAVSVLVKELANPRQMLEQFEIKSLGTSFSGTFNSLVQLHFWWGLVALSILIDPAGDHQRESFSSFLADPFGIWHFHLV